MAKIAEGMSDNTALFKSLDEFVSKKEEEITRTHAVKDVLFNGIPVNNFAGLVEGTEAAAEGEEATSGPPKLKLPESFSDAKFGFFKNVTAILA